MSWINSRQFTISNRNGRHYVFRRNNAGNTEINIPAHIVSKGQAVAWLKAHPDKVANPTRYRAKGKRAAPQPGGLKAFERMINGKKMIRFLNKEGKEYFRPAPVAGQKKKVVPATWDMTCDHLKDSLDSLTPLGKGRQGIVFAAKQPGSRRPFAVKVAPRDLAASKRGEPQPVDIEFKIQDAVQNYTPNVVRIYKNVRCDNFITPAQMNMPNVQNSARYDKSKQGILLMEYAAGGSLDSWLKKKAKVDDAIMAHIISDILGALFNIQKKYPDFRHNDLHMQNVFVADRGFLIGDFGWARLKKSGTNPAVNTANGTKTASFWGVGPNTDERYDHHLFLNEMLDWATRHAPATHAKAIEFLKMAVPPGYRGAKDTHVSEWRLKYDDPCTGLPSMAQVLSHPFLTGKERVTSINLKAGKAMLKLAKIKRVFSANLVKAKAALKAKNLRKPVRLITSLRLRKAKDKLKMVARPKPKPRITGYNLRAAKAKLRKVKALSPPRVKVPSPPMKKVVVPPALLRTAKFNKLVEKLWKNAGAASGANFQNAWNSARMKAIGVVENSLRKNKSAFSPSPPKPRNKLPSPLGPPPKNLNAAAKRLRQHAATLAAKRPKLLTTTKVPSPPKSPTKVQAAHEYSPTSGRIKVRGPSGRLVYANGAAISMNFLKNLARQRGKNITGLRSKVEIAKRIFSRNNK
jgi:hypothetical protein